MPDDIRQSVYNLLEQLPNRKLDALKQLFWAELNYNRANDPLSTRDWPQSVTEHWAEPPILFATAGQDDGFHVIYTRLNEEQLLLSPQRPIIGQLLNNYPYALFIFSNNQQTHWHFVNVRYEKDNDARTRRVFRRITIGPFERLRTATERISLLDIATLSPDLFGLSPLVIQQRHDEAFNVEAVTREFFRTYRTIFEQTERGITAIKEAETRRLFTQRLFNRLLFIVFLERKGWLTFNDGSRQRYDFLQALWESHRREKQAGEKVNFYNDRLKLLFFAGLNTENEVNIVGANPDGFLQTRIGRVPYLNGGLFEEDDLDRNAKIRVPDESLVPALDELLYRYNFTVTESTPLDMEVAVDPEMLGKIFEELVTGRHESGSYYTPKPVVAFMGQEALKGYLETSCSAETAAAIAAFVEQRNATGLRNPEQVLEALKTVKICDPACGSGAYLLGMLHELLDLRGALFTARHLDPLTAYQRKLEIIQNNLYGVDLDPFAVNIARLRLWLSLIVEFEGNNPPPLPNLDFKIEAGDSLIAPDPSGGLDLGFRKELIEKFFLLKSKHMLTHGLEKLTLYEEINQLRTEIALWSGHTNQIEGFDWVVDFAEVFVGLKLATTPSRGALVETSPRGEGGFDIVLANPPYVRADAPYRHISDEEQRQAVIAQWQQYRQTLKRSKIYETLFEKWDLYIPFLERAFQLLRPGGQMIFIIPDAYNAAKYTTKSHEFFLKYSTIVRLDFCSDIPLFEAGVSNTILHFVRARPNSMHIPQRFRRWGDGPEDFERNIEKLTSVSQVEFGRTLFRLDGQNPMPTDEEFVLLEKICYISKGMVIHADEREYQGEFTAEDVLSNVPDNRHPKRFALGKDMVKWGLRNIRYLEWGTRRAPKKFSRPTFPELHEAKEKLVAVRTPGAQPKVLYDDNSLHFDASSVGFILWYLLKDVINRSIEKMSKYKWQSLEGDREERESISNGFHPKYLLAIMNSDFARIWLARTRRSKLHVYPDDWKQLPIAPIPMKEQLEFVKLVDDILLEFEKYSYPLPSEASARVAKFEVEINKRVAQLYGIANETSLLLETEARKKDFDKAVKALDALRKKQ